MTERKILGMSVKEYNYDYYQKHKEEIYKHRKRKVECIYCNKKLSYESVYLHNKTVKHKTNVELYNLKNSSFQDSTQSQN